MEYSPSNTKKQIITPTLRQKIDMHNNEVFIGMARLYVHSGTDVNRGIELVRSGKIKRGSTVAL